MEEIIRARNVSFQYETGEEALRGINLSIYKGEKVAVVGPNGSGKSTFAQLLNAILVPTRGELTVAGMNTVDPEKTLDIRRRVGMVFQNPDNQLVATVVEEDVAFGPENLGVPPREIRERVERALEAVGMTDWRKSAPHQLSGGQKQRVAIAGVLAMLPECIVLDEPTAMLDPVGRREVLSTVLELNRARGITVVLVSHHMDEVAEMDRVIVMDKGTVAAAGAPRDIFSDEALLSRVGLEAPQPTRLMALLRKAGVNVPADALTGAEAAAALVGVLEGGR